jgi:hypothetical protein
MFLIEQPYKTYTDLNGKPINNGSVYIGVANSNPVTSPVTVYWDAAGTQPAIQPLDVMNGYIVRAGTPANVFVATSYSILIKDSRGRQVFYARTSDDFSVIAALLAFSASLASSIGASLIGFIQAGTGAVLQTIQAALRERVSVKQYGAVGDGSDATLAFQRAAAYLLSVGGGRAYIPRGIYLITAPITVGDNVVFYGEGDSSQILVNTDIEVFNSATTTVDTAVFRAEFRDFFINKTVAGATTKYDIHLQNPNICKFNNVHIKSGHNDAAYSAVNVGGIFLDKPAGSTSTAFMNRIKDCWIQNNSIYCKSLTDSSITGGYVWGHVREFAIRFAGGGANAVEKLEGIICSQHKGGIWLDGSGINQMRIHGNEFDGNPLLDTGTGVYAPASSIATSITGNTFWGCDKHGVDMTDPIGLTVTGNSFWKNNAADNFYDDVRITGVTFGPNGNVVSGNTHVIDDARANKGYAVREVNAGFNPVSNTYTGNGIFGNYQTPGILVLSQATVVGNAGLGSQDLTSLPGSTVVLGTSGLHKNVTADIAAAGTLDLSVNPALFLGVPGGAAGILAVTCTRNNFPAQSRRQLYQVCFIGTNANFTQLGSNIDGSGGGITFTITMGSAGVIRFTDTSGTPLTVAMTFNGVRQ